MSKLVVVFPSLVKTRKITIQVLKIFKQDGISKIWESISTKENG